MYCGCLTKVGGVTCVGAADGAGTEAGGAAGLQPNIIKLKSKTLNRVSPVISFECVFMQISPR